MEYNYPNTEPESLLEKVYRLLKTPTSTRTASIVIGVILLVALPVFLLVSQQQQNVSQFAYDPNNESDANINDCYPQIQYPKNDDVNWQNRDVARYQKKAKDAQEVVSIPAQTNFYMSFNLLNSAIGNRTLAPNETAVIWWHNAYNGDTANIIGLDGNAAVRRFGSDAVWSGHPAGTNDILTIPQMKYVTPGDYEVSFKIAPSLIDPSEVELNVPGSCANQNDNGWVTRKIVITGGSATGSGNDTVIQTLVHEDGRTAKLRRCPINTASTDPIGMFGACENWSEINLAPGDSYQGYDSFAYKNGATTYAMQTLVHEDGRTAKMRRCTMNPSARDVIGAFGTCDSWVEFNLPAGDSYRGLDTLFYDSPNIGPAVIQTLVHSDGRTAKLRQCLLFDKASSDPLAAYQKCQDWEEINLAPGDSYQEYDSFSYTNGTTASAVQSLTHEDGRTAKSRTCTMNTSAITAVSALGTCAAWVEFNLASGDSYRGYDALFYQGSGTGVIPTAAPVVATPTTNPHPDTIGQCTTGDTTRWRYTCSVSTNTTWACSGDVTNFRTIKCYKDCSDSTEITSCPIITPTPAYGAYTCNAGGKPGHCGPKVEPGGPENVYSRNCAGSWDYRGTGCTSAAERCYTECPGDSAPVNPPVSCQSIGAPAVCPNNPNKCLQTCDAATGTYWVTDPATSTHFASCNATTTISSCPVVATPTSTPAATNTPTPVGPTNTPTPTLHGDPPPTAPPGGTATPTSTTTPGNAQLTFNLELQGVGNATQGQAPKNATPKNVNRNLTVEIYDATTNRAVFTNTFTNAITYNSSTGQFSATVTVGPLSDGRYTVKVKTPKYLRRLMGKRNNQTTVTIKTGQNNTMPTETMIAGNANNDNVLTTADYQAYLACFAKQLTTGSCADVDFNDDGIIDSSTNNNVLDYNLLKFAFAVQDGD